MVLYISLEIQNFHFIDMIYKTCSAKKIKNECIEIKDCTFSKSINVLKEYCKFSVSR